MSALVYATRDSVTMLRRDLRHALRYPAMTLSGVFVPVLFLLLFAGVFGNALRAGLGQGTPLGGRYIDYIVPGILLMTASSGAEATAVKVSSDMSTGIIARFRSMAISRVSVLTGQVMGSLIRTGLSGLLVAGVAVALGFRPTAGPVGWAAAAGVFILLTVSLTWLGVAFGLIAKTPEGANSMALLLVVLPFVSSAFVPTSSMPAGVRWFAENQPFTPIIETLRALLAGTPVGSSGLVALAWCAALSAVGYLAARARYNRNPVR